MKLQLSTFRFGHTGLLLAWLAAPLAHSASTLERSWTGLSTLNAPGFEPPDTHGAAGPSGVLATVNTYIAYYQKSGSTIWGPFNLSTFFASTGNTGQGNADPKVVFDPASQRFFVVMQENTTSPPYKSFLNIAVSRSSNPPTASTNDWLLFRYEMTESILGQNYGGDYPGLAVDGRALYVTFNIFPLPLGGAANPDSWNIPAAHVRIFVVNKASLLAGSLAVRSVKAVTGFTLQPASIIGNSNPGNLAYLLQIDSPATARVWVLDDPLGGSRPLLAYDIPIPPTGPPVLGAPVLGAPQRGSSFRLDTVTPFRAQGNAFWRDGSLWFCYTGASDDFRAQVWFYEIRTHEFGVPLVPPVLKRVGTVQKNTDADWDFCPAIGGNPAGDVCMVFNRSSSSSYPAILYATIPHYSGPFDGFERAKYLTAASTFYNSAQDPDKNGARWGDYATVAADPTDGTFWICNEYALASVSTQNWATCWGNVSVPHALWYVDRNNPCGLPKDVTDMMSQWGLRTSDLPLNPFNWGTANSTPQQFCFDLPLSGFPLPPGLQPLHFCSSVFCLGGPYRTLAEGVQRSASGDQLLIKAANYDERPRINKHLVLSAQGGSVFIGKP